MKIKTNDNIIVLAGKEKGKTGKVIRIFKSENKVIVEGLNMVKKHRRPRKEGAKGQIVDIAMPLHISNIAIVDGKSGKASRVGYREENGKKVRFIKKSGATI